MECQRNEVAPSGVRPCAPPFDLGPGEFAAAFAPDRIRRARSAGLDG